MQYGMTLEMGRGIDITSDRLYVPRGDELDRRVARLLSLKAEGKSMKEIAEIMCPGMQLDEKVEDEI